jgi:hypothetical protein
MDIATCMYYTGIDPMTMQPVYVARKLRERKWQRALMQFFKPENYFLVREALLQAGRADLIGGCDGLIPAEPLPQALTQRRLSPQKTVEHDHYHAILPRRASPPHTGAKRKADSPDRMESRSVSSIGYRPGRKGHRRRERTSPAPNPPPSHS